MRSIAQTPSLLSTLMGGCGLQFIAWCGQLGSVVQWSRRSPAFTSAGDDAEPTCSLACVSCVRCHLYCGAGEELPGLGGARMPALEGDFSLNAANAISAGLFLRAGLARLAPTHDLNAAQICALARSLGPQGCGTINSLISNPILKRL